MSNRQGFHPFFFFFWQNHLVVLLSTDVTLAGLELGLLTMRKGESSRFLFNPQYAFGDRGCPPLIPAAAVILYEVEVVDFLDSGQVDHFIALSQVGIMKTEKTFTDFSVYGRK